MTLPSGEGQRPPQPLVDVSLARAPQVGAPISLDVSAAPKQSLADGMKQHLTMIQGGQVNDETVTRYTDQLKKLLKLEADGRLPENGNNQVQAARQQLAEFRKAGLADLVESAEPPPAIPSADVSAGLAAVDSALVGGQVGGQPARPEPAAPAGESANVAAARLALEASRGARGRVVEVYKRVDGLLDVLERRVKAIVTGKTQTAPESVAIQYDTKDLANPTNTKNLIDQQRDNRDGVTGTNNTRGYLDEMVVKAAGELEGLEKQRTKLEASRDRNLAAPADGSQGAITVLPKGSDIAGQSEPVTLDVAVGQATEVEKNAWLTAKNAEITAGNAQKGKLKRKTPLLTEIPAEVTTLNVTRTQVKKRSEDEYTFDPERAAPVVEARKQLTNARLENVKAEEDLKEHCADKGITNQNRATYEALYQIMEYLHISAIDGPDKARKIFEEYKANPQNDIDINQIVQIAAGKGGKIDLSYLGKRASDFDLSTPDGVFNYLASRLNDEALLGFEVERVNVDVKREVIDRAKDEFNYRLYDARRWSVDSQGRPTGAGYQELADAERQTTNILATLGDSAIIDLYLQESYLPTAEEGTQIDDAQKQIAGINTDIAAIDAELNRLMSKRQGETSEVILAAINQEGETNYHRKKDLEGQQNALLMSINQIIDPTARLHRAAENIGELTPSRVRSKLGLLGLSTEDIPQSLERVGDAVNQTLDELRLSGKVPSELELYGMVITKLRGEPAPQIVEAPPASEEPPAPAVPAAPAAPGAAVAGVEPEAGAAGAEAATAEQSADNRVDTVLNGITDDNDRLGLIMAGKNIDGEIRGKPELAGTYNAVVQLANMDEKTRSKSLKYMLDYIDKHPSREGSVDENTRNYSLVTRLYDILGRLKMTYPELVALGHKKESSLGGPAAAAVGLMLLLQSLSKVDAEAMGAASQQAEQ